MKAKLDDGREVTINVDEKGNAAVSQITEAKGSASTASASISEKSSYTTASSSASKDPPSY